MRISGGIAELRGQYFGVGVASNSTGTVLLTGGELTTIDPRIGMSGIGQMTVSNGIWRVPPFNYAAVGYGPGGWGTLTLAGGTSIFSAPLYIAFSSSATGSVYLAGGELISTNFNTTVGYDGFGQMTVSNGLWHARDVNIGLSFSLSTNTHVLSIAGVIKSG